MMRQRGFDALEGAFHLWDCFWLYVGLFSHEFSETVTVAIFSNPARPNNPLSLKAKIASEVNGWWRHSIWPSRLFTGCINHKST